MHNHKSTGIASGLEYRPGYRVGGRVGFADGSLPNFNPELSITNPREGFETAGSLGYLGPKELKIGNKREREIGRAFKD